MKLLKSLLVLSICLMMSSCKSCQPKVEPIKIDFPDFPVYEGEYSIDGDLVTVNGEWIRDLYMFREQYNLLKEEYNGRL